MTQQSLDDAVETIRERTDALGVSEPEIQRSGRDQISVGLPDVQNADRAIEQVGTTAQLQFYDWEPNMLGDRGPDAPYAGLKGLYQAVEAASKEEGKAEAADVPPGSDMSPGAGRPPERLGRRPPLPLRPRPAPDRPGQGAAPRGQLPAVRELRRAARRLRAGAGRGARVRRRHAVPGGARGARRGRSARGLASDRGPAGRGGRRGGARSRASRSACNASSCSRTTRS